MALLAPNQPLPEDDETPCKSRRGSSIITVVACAEFVNLTPAHQRYITKVGTGSNVDRAARDAIRNVFADPRLKGKRHRFPIKILISEG